MAKLRTKLFLSYSKADAAWRDRFREHLNTLVPADELWIDCKDIQSGAQWSDEITAAIAEAKCALLLLTPSYLNRESFARRELERLIDEQTKGLILLPVLVADCAWPDVPGLNLNQFMRGRGGTRLEPADGGPREGLRPLEQAEQTDLAVVEMCQHVKAALGVVAQTTSLQMDQLLTDTQRALGDRVSLGEPMHSGDFSVVYRGDLFGKSVAVKVVPDAPRQNRIRKEFDAVLPLLMKLEDPVFIRINFAVSTGEPRCLVMDYVDWPTLEMRMAAEPGHRLAPRTVAHVLAQLARAQDEAHRHGLQIGPLSLHSIHVGEDWRIRLSALRIEGVVSRTAHMAGGQLLNWEALTSLAPEISEGQEPRTRAELDALEQYYLGLLGLELLLGRKPCTVRRFSDFTVKSRFFRHPRAFFGEPGTAEAAWMHESPALAFLIRRMLDRDPARRLPSTAAAEADLEALAADRLPPTLRRQLEEDLDHLAQERFVSAFYARLFTLRPGLRSAFHGDAAVQARMLADALPDLLDFDPGLGPHAHFQRLARRHAGYGIGPEDVAAFHEAFLAQVQVEFPDDPGRAETWNAVLTRCLGYLSRLLTQA